MFLTVLLSILTSSGDSDASALVPEIEARRFDIKAVQKSTSGKIYLFESKIIPKTGNLVLVYDGVRPSMAFRVLKNDPDKNQFVAKRIRRYDNISDLSINQSYSSIEKVADLLPTPENLSKPILANAQPESTSTETPAKTEELPGDTVATDESGKPVEDKSEVAQSEPANEQPTEINDPELDASTVQKLDQIDQENPSDDLEMASIEFDEYPFLDPFNNMISVGVGYYGNASNFTLSPTYQNGFGLSFSRVLARNVFLDSKTIQDGFALEVGVIQYSILNLDSNNDRYSMLPFYGNLIYQLYTGHTFGVHGYGGLQFNYMVSASNPGSSLEDLQGFQPNFGIGFTYMMGPQWYFRAEIGWDRAIGGLSLKW